MLLEFIINRTRISKIVSPRAILFFFLFRHYKGSPVFVLHFVRGRPTRLRFRYYDRFINIQCVYVEVAPILTNDLDVYNNYTTGVYTAVYRVFWSLSVKHCM